MHPIAGTDSLCCIAFANCMHACMHGSFPNGCTSTQRDTMSIIYIPYDTPYTTITISVVWYYLKTSSVFVRGCALLFSTHNTFEEDGSRHCYSFAVFGGGCHHLLSAFGDGSCSSAFLSCAPGLPCCSRSNLGIPQSCNQVMSMFFFFFLLWVLY